MSHREFIETVKANGLARANRFRVDIPLPQILLEATTEDEGERNKVVETLGAIIRIVAGTGGEGSRGLSIMCESTELPATNIVTMENRHNGDTYTLPYGRLYNVQPFTFLCTSQMYEKNLLDMWMNLVIDKTNFRMSYFEEYVTDITIHQLDSYDRPTHSIILKNAYPKQVSPVVVSNSSRDELSRLNCEFVFSKWMTPEEQATAQEGLGSLGETAAFPAISDFLQDNPNVQKGLNVLSGLGLDLEGEALNIYNQVDKIIQQTTGGSINDITAAIGRIKTDTVFNTKISASDKSALLDGMDSVIAAFKS